MGILNRFSRKKEADAAPRAVAGSGLAAVLPDHGKPWWRVPHLIKLNLLLLIPLASSGAIGYDGSMMNGLQALPQWREYFDNPEGNILGAMNSVYPAGKFFALFLVTWICDKYGRKTALLIGCVTCIAFAIMQCFSRNVEMFVASRALLGFFTSFLAQPSPILIAETAYPTHRGKLTALYHTSFYLGGIIAAWLTFGTFQLATSWSWRIPSLLQGMIPFLQLLGFWFLPESPRWLVANGRREQARAILVKYHGGGDEDSPLVNFEMSEIENALIAESDNSSSWLELFRTPANRKRTAIACTVGWFAQWNGIGVVSYYLFLVLRTIGITEPKEQTLINGCLQISNWISAVFVGAMLVDRVGRRTLFLTSTAGMCVSYCIWTGLTSHFVKTQDPAVGRSVLAFIFITFFFYAMAWAPLLAGYTVELFPYRLRSRGISVMYLSTFAGLVVSNQLSPLALRDLEWKYYIFFCCLLACLWILIYFLFPETKGYSLEEIAEIFEGPSASTAKAQDIEADATEVKREESAKEHHVETTTQKA